MKKTVHIGHHDYYNHIEEKRVEKDQLTWLSRRQNASRVEWNKIVFLEADTSQFILRSLYFAVWIYGADQTVRM